MKLRDPKWLSIFRINERVAAEFWKGNIFLLGDAAHIHSPAGGQGMNTGMQDAANLAWKLSLLLRGRGDEAIIKQSYQEERHPVAVNVVKGATQKLHFGMAKGMAVRAIKDVAISLLLHVPAFRQHVTRDLSELEIHYQGPLVDVSAPWEHKKSGFVPGSRPRDVSVRDENGETVSLWRRFLRPKHTLLLFSGKSPVGIDETTRKLISLCCSDAGSEIEPILVWQGTEAPAVDCCECLLDADGEAHRRYGAEKGGWYLIRPDQYVAARCQPASMEPLESYISKVLKS